MLLGILNILVDHFAGDDEISEFLVPAAKIDRSIDEKVLSAFAQHLKQGVVAEEHSGELSTIVHINAPDSICEQVDNTEALLRKVQNLSALYPFPNDQYVDYTLQVNV